MVRKSYTPEQIINKLREAEIFLGQGATIGNTHTKQECIVIDMDALN